MYYVYIEVNEEIEPYLLTLVILVMCSSKYFLWSGEMVVL